MSMAEKTAQSTDTTVIRRRFTGEVVSTAEDKTIHVRVKEAKMHPKYRKQYSETKKFAVHDEKNEAKVGDTVIFQECRPFSKTKRWRVVEIVK